MGNKPPCCAGQFGDGMNLNAVRGPNPTIVVDNPDGVRQTFKPRPANDSDDDSDSVWAERQPGCWEEAELISSAIDGHCLIRYHEDSSMELLPPEKMNRSNEDQEEVWVQWNGEWCMATLVAVATAGQQLVQYYADFEMDLLSNARVREEMNGERARNRTATRMSCVSNGNRSRIHSGVPLSADERTMWLRRAKEGISRKMWEGAPNSVKCDKEIILEALKTAGNSGFDAAMFYKCAPERTRGDRTVYEAALAAAGADAAQGVFKACPPNKQDDRTWILSCIKVVKGSHVASVLQTMAESRLSDFHIATAAVTKNGDTLSFFSPALKANKEIVGRAVRSKPDALEHASEELQKDQELLDIVAGKAPQGGMDA